MNDALIGVTGFVGGTLARQRHYTATFHSKNIHEIAGRSFDRIDVAGMPAAKWIANGDPAADHANYLKLWDHLRQASAGQVVVLSTVDVYPKPIGVREDTPIDPTQQQAYGRNRLLLETSVAEHFPNALIVRLPGLFGEGLRKNAIYDFLHDNATHKIPSEGSFQFYDMSRLADDIETALAAKLKLVNFAVEPTTVREVVQHAFGRDFVNDTGSAPVYDMQTNYASIFGGADGYFETRAQVLNRLQAFVAAERSKA